MQGDGGDLQFHDLSAARCAGGPAVGAGMGDAAVQQLPVGVGEGKPPLPPGHGEGLGAGQSGGDRPPTGQLTGVVVASEQGGQPYPQLHARAGGAALGHRLTGRATPLLSRRSASFVVVKLLVVGLVVRGLVVALRCLARVVVVWLVDVVWLVAVIGGAQALEDGRIVQPVVGTVGHAEEQLGADVVEGAGIASVFGGLGECVDVPAGRRDSSRKRCSAQPIFCTSAAAFISPSRSRARSS